MKIERHEDDDPEEMEWRNQFTICRIDARVLCKKWRAAERSTPRRKGGKVERVEREYETCSRGNRNHILNFHKRVRRATLSALASSPSFPFPPLFRPVFHPSSDPPTGEKIASSSSLFLSSSKRSSKLRKHISFILLPRSRLCHSAHPLDPSRSISRPLFVTLPLCRPGST